MNLGLRSPRPYVLRLLLAAAVLCGVGVGTLRARADGPPTAEFDGLLVAFKDSTPLDDRLDVVKHYQLTVDTSVNSPYFAKVYPAPGQPVADLLNALKQDPSVRIAEPNYLRRKLSAPNDPRYREQWHLNNTGQTGGIAGADIRAESAWNKIRDARTIRVAIIDTGVQYTHPDLAPNIARDPSGQLIGFDFANNDANPDDDDGHGTHVAGIVGARGDNNLGVSGVAQVVQLIPIKFLTPTGGSTAAEILSIDYAIANGAKVINASYGGFGRSQIEADAIKRTQTAGILFVAACGNFTIDNDSFPVYPTNFSTEFDNVVAVAATDDRDSIAGFSDYGRTTVTLGAPGENILSTYPSNTYTLLSGTSMAAPVVSGAAALVLASRPGINYQTAKALIIGGVRPLPTLAGKCTTEGRLDLDGALKGHITVLTPNGDETFLFGENVDITWQTSNLLPGDEVKIELSSDGGQTFPRLIKDKVTATTGKFTWTIPLSGLKPTTQARIRVSVLSDLTVNDISDVDFSITDGIRTGPICTPTLSQAIPDNFRSDADWAKSSLLFPTDQIIRGIEVSVDVDHPHPGDLQVFLVPPDAPDNPTVSDMVLLHNQTGARGNGISALYPKPDAPAESLRVLVGRRSRVADPKTGQDRPWQLWVRDLISGDVGFVKRWCLKVIGPLTGTLTVTSPNGGERLAVGDTTNITWSVNGVVGDVRVQLSRDGGKNFTTLGTVDVTTGNFPWTVTAPVTQNARIRLVSVDSPVITDVSDKVFSIEQPFLQILTPNGGEQVSTGKPYTIRWDDVPRTGTVTIQLSRDGGQNWTTITSAAVDTGTFDWTPPLGSDTTQAKIRITANTGLARSDESDAVFTLQTPALTVISPAAGTTWFTGTEQTVTWSSVGIGDAAGRVRIQLFRNNAIENLTLSTENDGMETFTVTEPEATDARIIITSLNEPGVSGSSGIFSIKRMGITVTSPNGGEVIGAGFPTTITWESQGVPGNVDIELSRDGGTTFEEVATDVPNTGSYVAALDGPGTNQALIRITANGFDAFDVSDKVFTLVEPSITIVSPNGGEELRVGHKATLSWTTRGVPAGTLADIEISRDGGKTFGPLFSGVQADQPKEWTVTGPSDAAILRVSLVGTPTASDTSDQVFRIVTPGITVTSPNGGEQWASLSTQTITWTSAGFDGSVVVELTRDGGQHWEAIYPSTENTGSVDWMVTGPPSTNARIRVRSLANASIGDESDGPFTIVHPTITVGRPNGGVTLLIGTTQSITWGSTNLPVSSPVRIEISRDNGLNWQTIIASTRNDGAEGWRVTGPESRNARIRITSLDRPDVSDQSDRTFSLVRPSIKVTSPRSGERWLVGARKTITWTGTTRQQNSGLVDVYLSRDGGKSWQRIISDTRNDGSVGWLVTGPTTNAAKVRVVWKTSEDVMGDSPGTFTIAEGRRR